MKKKKLNNMQTLAYEISVSANIIHSYLNC